MNSLSVRSCLAAALSPGLFFLSSCTKTESAGDNLVTATKSLALDAKAEAVESWDSFKDFTYDQRAAFSSGAARLDRKMDEKISAMNAKFHGLPDGAAQNRDRAMKELAEARADLKIRLDALEHASAETWGEAKAKANESWHRVEAAYDKAATAS